MKLWKEFKEFIARGNVIDLAVGVMIGGAFNKIVTSIVNDLFMPLISLLTGGIEFTALFVPLDGNSYPSLQAAVDAEAPILSYGAFIGSIIDFLLLALCVFLIVKLINRVRSKNAATEPEPAVEFICPFCMSSVNEKATRCPHCTSPLPDGPQKV